jgi:AcrR family transcriptional regulator
MKYGIKSITMDDLARSLGVSKKTIYREVDNKEDLIRKVICMEMQESKADMEGVRNDSRDAIEEMVKMAKLIIQKTRSISPTTYYDLQKYYRNVWHQLEEMRVEYIYSKIRGNIEWGIEEGLYRKDVNAEIIAKLYIHKTRLMTDEEIFSLERYQRDELILQFISYHLHGIMSMKGLKLWKQYKHEILEAN